MQVLSTFLSGYPTSLVESQVITTLSSDLFLVSLLHLTSVNPSRSYESNGKVYTNSYISKNFSYSDLSGLLYNLIFSALGLKSMAWELSDHYSSANHLHEYSNVECDPKEYDSTNAISSLFEIVVDSKKFEYYMPRIVRYRLPDPYIGQLKFISTRTLPSINVNAADFDGWVYPDGREILSTTFRKAWNVFGTTYGVGATANSFKIPNLNNFVLLKSSPNDSSNYSTRLNEVTLIPSHMHSLHEMNFDGEATGTLEILNYNNYGSLAGGTHGVQSKPNNATYVEKLYFKCNGLTCDNTDVVNEAEITNDSTYPTHNLLPVLMFIGTRNMK